MARVAPEVTGVSRQGELLHASAGEWANPVTGYAFRWRRCDPAGSCVDIAGALATSYRVAAADVGSTLRVRITATNAAGEASADSAPTGVVVARSLLSGGSFEQAPGRVYTTRGEARFAWARDQSHSPSHSLRISSAAGGPGRWVARVPARAGTRYAVSTWVRTARLRGRVELALTFWSASGAARGEAVVWAGQKTLWRRLSLARVAPRGTAFVRVELRQAGSGTSWWDDLTLTDGRAAG